MKKLRSIFILDLAFKTESLNLAIKTENPAPKEAAFRPSPPCKDQFAYHDYGPKIFPYFAAFAVDERRQTQVRYTSRSIFDLRFFQNSRRSSVDYETLEAFAMYGNHA
jgi:hypothetical protein